LPGRTTPAQTVTWSIETADTAGGTGIDADGLLTVANDETQDAITVKAASTADTSKSGAKQVSVLTPIVITGTVTIDGTPAKGETLIANISGLDGSAGGETYQWKRGTTDISRATGSTYILRAADYGKTVTVQVSRAGYSGSIISPATAVVDGTFVVDEEGPAGGKIAYVASGSGFTTTATICYYLEAAPADIDGRQTWTTEAFYSTDIPGTDRIIGTGAANTAAILAADANAPAAKACAEYTLGSYDDWFLPSYDELYELYRNRTDIGGFTTLFLLVFFAA
jgi:hypothetical protein